jgi:hypothetical protein
LPLVALKFFRQVFEQVQALITEADPAGADPDRAVRYRCVSVVRVAARHAELVFDLQDGDARVGGSSVSISAACGAGVQCYGPCGAGVARGR